MYVRIRKPPTQSLSRGRDRLMFIYAPSVNRKLEALRLMGIFYNDEVFGGSLTKWTVEAMPVRKSFKGDCNEDKYRIRVTMNEDWIETLLHEMCHASVGCEHGHDEVWKAEVRRVSKATGIAINQTPYGAQNDEGWQSKARTEMESWLNELKAQNGGPNTVTRALDELTFLRKRKLLTADEYKGYKSQIMAYMR